MTTHPKKGTPMNTPQEEQPAPNVASVQGAREARWVKLVADTAYEFSLSNRRADTWHDVLGAALTGAADAEQAELRAEVERLTEDRDMFRDKAHGFITANRAYDERLGALVSGLQRAIVRAERLPECVVPTDHLRFLLGDDEPNVGGSDE